jgi:hypothetical protein
MKRCFVLILSLMMCVSVIAMPVFAAGNGYRWHRTGSEERVCGGFGRLDRCRCGEDPCGSRSVYPVCWDDNRGRCWGWNTDSESEFQGKNYVDEDGDGLCDRCGRDAGIPNEPGSQTNDGNRGVCDGTGPKGKGRGRRNR